MSYQDKMRASHQPLVLPKNGERLMPLAGSNLQTRHRPAILVWFSKEWLFCAVILFAVFTRLPLMIAPLTYSATDVWRQTDTATIARNFHENGYRILYPQINWGGDGPGYVEAEFQLYTFITAGLYGVFGEHEWVGRLVSLFFMTGALILFYLLTKRLLNPRIAIAALILMTLSPLTVRYSTAFMPEATVFFFYIAALYFFIVWLDTQRTSTLILAALSTSLAILVKPTSLHIGLVFLFLLIKHFRLAWIKQPQIWMFGAISLLPTVAYYLHARDLYLTYGNTFGLFSGGDSKFGNLNFWLSTTFYTNIISLEMHWIWGWTGVIWLGLGLYAWRSKFPSFFIIIALIANAMYFMIVARYAEKEWGIQYHIFMLPYAALGMGMGLIWFLDQVPYFFKRFSTSLTSILGLGAVAVLMLGFAPSFGQLAVPESQALEDCGVHVQEIVPEDGLIIASTFAPLYASNSNAVNNYQEPHIFYYSDRKGWSLPREWNTPEKVEEYRRQGADYYVIHHDHQLIDNPALQAYLDANTLQIGTGTPEGCFIFKFNPNPPPTAHFFGG